METTTKPANQLRRADHIALTETIYDEEGPRQETSIQMVRHLEHRERWDDLERQTYRSVFVGFGPTPDDQFIVYGWDEPVEVVLRHTLQS